MIQVLVLLVVSGVIAYLGDVLGTNVGKRRLTIFGFRPRVTAIIVSISTGILITLLTLITAAVLSDNVKIALFSVQQLRKEREKLAEDVTGLQKERTQLQLDVETLKNRVRVKEQEFVVVRKDSPLAAMVLHGGQVPTQAILASLTEFIGTLSQKAVERGLKVKDKVLLIRENQEQLTRMADHIASANEEIVVAAIAAENKSLGEDLGQVIFRVRENSLIFNAGDEIATLEVDGRSARGQIAKTLQDFTEEINYEVVRQGMIGNPLTGRFGDLSSESMLSFFDLVNQIKQLGRKLALVAVVKEDTYAIGPLNVSFRLEEEPENE